MIGLARAVGIAARWLVIDGPPEFFEITKRIDNGVSGIAGDGGPLGEPEAVLYEQVSRVLTEQIAHFVVPGDRVVLHDPQTAGLCTALRELGAIVTWRAHNGADRPNEHSVRPWNFLHRYISRADGLIATTDDFRPPTLSTLPYMSIAPFIDPTSAKNRVLTESEVHARLERWGIIDGPARPARIPPGYELYREGPPPTSRTPMIAQISRWDRVKDMAGVLDSFEHTIAPFTDAHLTLAGPEVTGVADDPEAADYLAYCVSRWRALPRQVRRRVQLVCLPMSDVTDNALTINALQRHAVVVMQKSRSEGFGLTVAEAMWKRTPVVATAVGGIRLQIPSAEQGTTVALDGPKRSVRQCCARATRSTPAASPNRRARPRAHSHPFSAGHPADSRTRFLPTTLTGGHSMTLRIMAIGAHPDDIEILAAGTLARYRERGHAIAVCILTDGRLSAPSGDPDDVAATRREEAQAAAHLLGAELYWIGRPDGMLYDDPDTRAAVVDAVRAFSPNIVFAHDPNDYHPDHRAASTIAMSARQLATAPLFNTGTHPLKAAPSVFYMDPLGLVGDSPELWVDIPTTVDIKRQMLWCHKSQNRMAAEHRRHRLRDLRRQTRTDPRVAMRGLLRRRIPSRTHLPGRSRM
ncbi:PIG-L family deacetylase [Rhodococcus sp. 14-2470-1a]|uniref:PIG-L family deacetylase n=1 Tax=Rhodococcus sp. 14-2470-1a TaxID=2023150 RepID=UPI000B9C06FA|nr:PIG-L family deacetylase [Rhodococcus sp. 14-2470-1a]OZF42072.1 hypothetical protein CH292_26630 [Rhodococcus sp. 14-2470-1a]